MELQRMVQRHALLTVGLQRDKAARRQSPPKIYAELQRIETRAQAMLSPQELAQAQQASVTIQAQGTKALALVR